MPSLLREGTTLRAYVGHAAGGGEAQDVTLGEPLVRARTFSSTDVPLRAPAEDDVQIVPLFARQQKRWFSVIEAKRGATDGIRRVRLVERDQTGRATVRATHEVGPREEMGNGRYDRAGYVAVVPLGESVYGVTRAVPIVLEGPGRDIDLFRQHDDPDCPANKRCFLMPARYDLTKVAGVAPDGSFVIVDGGTILRVSARGTRSFGYESFAFCGAVMNDHVVLAHAGEPPHVTRWAPPSAGAAAARGVGTEIATGAFVALAEDEAGVVVYGIRDDGVLVRFGGGPAAPAFVPPTGCRVGAAVASSRGAAFVVSCAMPGATMQHRVLVGG